MGQPKGSSNETERNGMEQYNTVNEMLACYKRNGKLMTLANGQRCQQKRKATKKTEHISAIWVKL